MSIKSDKWIKQQCLPPTHLLTGGPSSSRIIGRAWAGITHTAEQLADMTNRYHATPVTPEMLEDLDWQPMIEPFEPGQIKSRQRAQPKAGEPWAGVPQYSLKDGQFQQVTEDKLISYGTSSYGYDVRCGREFKVFTNINSTIIDPKAFDDRNFVDVNSDVCIIPPNSFALARTVEYFRIPRDVLTICLGKSTYARCGIIVNVTPLEPEWEGQVTLEFSNTTNLPAKIYANEGVAQMLFLQSDEACEVSYKDRGGKYQGQTGVTLPKA